MDVSVPSDFFYDQTETMRLPKIPMTEKHMSAGISSSLSGQLFKVMYVLQFHVVHVGHKVAVKVNFPVMVMTPDSSIIKSNKTRVNDHPGWHNNTYMFS